MPEEQNNSSPSDAQRAPDATLQRSTPKEDATSQRDTAGDNVHDPEKKKLHEEAASYRKRAKDLEAELKIYQDAEKAKQEADLSELEKTNNRLAEKDQLIQEREQLIQQLKQQLVTAETKVIASGMGFHNPEIAAKIVHDALEFGDDGKPTNLEKALTDIAKQNPFLVKPKQEATEQQQPTNPAQTAQPPAQQTPAIPAMNPGRTTIAPPNQGQLPPGTPVRLDQIQWKRR